MTSPTMYYYTKVMSELFLDSQFPDTKNTFRGLTTMQDAWRVSICFIRKYLTFIFIVFIFIANYKTFYIVCIKFMTAFFSFSTVTKLSILLLLAFKHLKLL